MTAPRRSLALRLFWRAHRWLLGISGGRVGSRVQGMSVLELTTRGRRTGAARTAALQYVPDGERLVVIASNAGDRRHPAWWLNLRAHPEAEVRLNGRRTAVSGREAVGDERGRL